MPNNSKNVDLGHENSNGITRREFVEGAAATGMLLVTPQIRGKAHATVSSQEPMHQEQDEKRTDMTAEDVEQELQSDRVEWVRAGDIKKMCCVDGRCKECVAGVAGGEAGLLAATLSTLDENVSDDMMNRIVNEMEDAYLHTDSHGLAHVREDLGLNTELSDKETERVLRGMADDPNQLDRILEVMTKPDSQGCGHLKNMMKDPEAYGTRAEIVEGVVKAIVRKWLRQLPGAVHGKHATVQCLEGEHEERALVQVNLIGDITPDTMIPFIKPNEGEGKKEFFIYMPQVANLRIEQIAAIVEQKTGRKISVTLSQERSGAQTLETAKRLAHGKPHIIAECTLQTQQFAVKDNGLVPGKNT